MHIIRLLVIFLSLCVGIEPLFAQENSYFGLHGGLSIPQLQGGGNNEVSRDFKSRAAANFGAFVEFGMKRKLSIQLEANFAGNGGKRTGLQPITSAPEGLPPLPPGSYFYADFKNEAILDYLEIPVLLKYRFGSTTKKRFYLNGGVFYGLLLSAKTKTSGSSTIYLDRNRTPLLLPPDGQPLPPISFDATTDVKSDLRKNNFGVTGGGGFEIPHGKNYFFVELRIAYGLTNIQKDTATNGSDHTGNLIISAGYAFKVK